MKKHIQEKRGASLALKALVSVVLSVLALYVVLKIFAGFLLVASANEDIAYQNAKSISEFTNYFDDSPIYKSYSSCYGVLNLERIHNFQFEPDENEDSFVYVIDRTAVHAVNLNDLTTVLSSSNVDSVRKKSFCFEEGTLGCTEDVMELYIDETEQGLGISFSIEFFDLGGFDSDLDLRKLPDDALIIMIPKFGNLENQNTYEILVLDSSQSQSCAEQAANSLHGVALNCENNQISQAQLSVGGKNLVYDKDENHLFVSGGEISDLLVKQNLCSTRDLNNRDIESFYRSNPDRIDSLNNNIFIAYVSDTYTSPVSFEWVSSPICKRENVEVSCTSLTDNLFFNVERFSYSTFYDTILSYYSQNIPSYEKRHVKVSTEPILGDQFLTSEDIPRFSDVFEVSDLHTRGKDSDWREEHNVFTFSDGVPCDASVCEDIIYQDNLIYFYIQDYDKFFAFRHHYLRKLYEPSSYGPGDKVLYIGNDGQGEIIKELAYNKIEADGEGLSFFPSSDDLDVYQLFRLRVKLDASETIREYDVLLSKRQFESIPELRNS